MIDGLSSTVASSSTGCATLSRASTLLSPPGKFVYPTAVDVGSAREWLRGSFTCVRRESVIALVHCLRSPALNPLWIRDRDSVVPEVSYAGSTDSEWLVSIQVGKSIPAST